jgi:hypothetical protein
MNSMIAEQSERRGAVGSGIAVGHEGEVGAGDEISVIGRDQNGVPASEIARLYAVKRYRDAVVGKSRVRRNQSLP